MASNSIKGVVLGDEELRVLAYADDVAFVCSSKEQAREVVELAQSFCRFSGAQLNLSKSEGAWLGEWLAKPQQLYGVRWRDAITGYLGVNLDCETATAPRWQSKLAAAGRKLEPWRARHITFFSRAHVCNSVLYPAILYVARVSTIDAGSVARFHRTFAVFIWRSTYEPMRRTNIFWSPEAGGLGLVNVELKLTVQRFMFFRDRRDGFLQAALQSVGSLHLAPWLATTALLTHGARATGFYREVAGAVALLQGLFSWEYLCVAKPKKLYWDLVEQTFPPPMYRAPPLGRLKSDVLRRVRKLPVPTGSKDFFFRLHTGVLPTKARQEERGFFLPGGANCLLCGRRETLEHVFVECNTALHFWGELQCSFNTHWELTWMNFRFLEAASDCPLLRDCVHVMGLHSLWRARVDAVECAERPRPAWRHFFQKAQWAVAALDGPDSDPELRDSLARGSRALMEFKVKQQRKWDLI